MQMLRWVALSALFVACVSPQSSGASTSPTSTTLAQVSASPAAASALQSIAARPGDFPTGLTTCSWSGDLVAYANSAKATAAGWSQQLLDLWQQLHSGGATAGWIQDLSVSEEACKGFYSGRAGLVSHVTCVVVLFKDRDSAMKAYTTNKSPLGLFSGGKFEGAPTDSGTSTGLGPNSIVVSPIVVSGIYAAWQKNAYYILVIAHGLSLSDDKLALGKIDARIP